MSFTKPGLLSRLWLLAFIAVYFSRRDSLLGFAPGVFLFAHSLPQKSVQLFTAEKQMAQHPIRAQQAPVY